MNKLDYEEKTNDVEQIMSGIKSTLNDRYGQLMTQSEKMELNMVNEIKQESVLNKNKKKK